MICAASRKRMSDGRRFRDRQVSAGTVVSPVGPTGMCTWSNVYVVDKHAVTSSYYTPCFVLETPWIFLPN